MKRIKTTCVVTALLLVLVSSAVQGALVTFEFAATVTDVPAELASQFVVGQPIVGAYTFDSSTSRNGTFYLSAIRSFNVSIAGYTLTSSGAGDIEIVNGAPDSYVAVSFSNGSSIGGRSPIIHTIQMNDDTGTALTSDALTTVPPDVFAFADRRFTVDFSGSGTPRLTGTISSLVAVPEPGSALPLAIATLFALRRRRS